MPSEVKKILFRKLAERTVKNLRRNWFEADYVENASDALPLIMGMLPQSALVGMGDSLTLQELGVIDELERGNYQFLNPWKTGIKRAESLRLRRQALTSDIFLTGTNAVTLDGKLVNIDGLGNRVAGMIFGPARVIVAVGANKIVPDTEKALARIKGIAAPLNVIRHEFGPDVRPGCRETGICSECKPPHTICCNTVIIENCSRDRGRIRVIIIGETLGY
jgi:L-lactate utilization protein LutB